MKVKLVHVFVIEPVSEANQRLFNTKKGDFEIFDSDGYRVSFANSVEQAKTTLLSLALSSGLGNCEIEGDEL